MIRVDLAERLARHAHEARTGQRGDALDQGLITSLGLRPESVAKLMRDIGFRSKGEEAGWVWRGRVRRPKPPAAPGSPAFAALAGLKRG